MAQAASAANVWVFSDRHQALRWNGRNWIPVARFPARYVSGAVVISRFDVWVFGQQYGFSGSAGAWHYNGQAWARVPAARPFEDASATSASDLWAYGATVIGHWNGTSWRTVSVRTLLPPPTTYCGPAVNGIYAVSATDAWAVGGAVCQDMPGPAVLLHYTGGAWHLAARLGRYNPLTVIPDGRGGLWIPAQGEQSPSAILYYTHGKLTGAHLPVPGLQLVLEGAAATGRTAWAVGRRVVDHRAGIAVILIDRT